MHVIKLNGYNATTENGEKLELGTFDSYGEEQLQIVKAPDWVNLSVIATFNPPNKKPVQVAVDSVTGVIKVPKEATADLYGVGTIVFVGLADGVQRISADCEYIVRKHSNASGTEPAEPTPDLLQQVLTLSRDAQTAAKNAEQSAKNAEQSAKNAAKDAADTVKPYKEEAVQAATAAALSEKNAAESKAAAQEAAERATQAGIAASNAAEEAERSAGIATDAAGGSALNAENARKSALNAQQSANNAAESQSVAKANADAAAKSQQSAAIDAKTASDSKVAAAGSAEAAAGSANAAENSASAAAGSEQAAGTSELKAAKSEKAAKASEQAAAESAQAALESKTAAATSEVNAAASAKKAQDVADSLPADYTTAVKEIAALKTNKADKTELETVEQQVANITPDDSTIGEKPWSSKHIIDMLCPPLQESGNPVVCYPVAGYPLGVKAKWEPMQDGSGTPSPENIRPIKGRSSVKVERCGENLLDVAQCRAATPSAAYGLTVTVDDTGLIRVFGTPKVNKDIPQATFRVLFTDQVTLAKLTKGYNAKLFVLKGVANSITRIQSDKSIVLQSPLSPNTPVDIQFRFMYYTGTTAPTTYTPYIGQTNTLTMPETVYGGEVDAVTGDAKETWKAITLDGTEEWTFQTTNIPGKSGFVFQVPEIATPENPEIKGDIVCSQYPAVTANDTYQCKNGISVEAQKYHYFRIYNDTYAGGTIDEWKSYLAAQHEAGTPVQVCYKLAEPVPFTATGAQPIPALAGANTVLTDADSATVTGRADPIKRIEDLEAAVASIN